MTVKKNELEDISLILKQRKADLLQVRETAEGAAGVVELDQTRVGRLSRMDALQAQAMSVETNRRRDIELQRIESALQRLRTGAYGYCLRCAEKISRPRLEVDPATPLCIDCASGK